jgi:hypothetical protein
VSAAADVAGSADWATNHANLRRLCLLRDADATFGALGRADENHAATMARLKQHAGSIAEATSSLAGRESCRAYAAAQDAWWRDLSEPSQEAARVLVLTPAPDVDAIAIKVRIIREFELDLDKNMPRDCMEILHEDSARVAAGTVLPFGGDRPPIAVDLATAHLANADQLAETISTLISPDRHSAAGLLQALKLLHLQQDELRRAAEAMGETL